MIQFFYPEIFRFFPEFPTLAASSDLGGGPRSEPIGNFGNVLQNSEINEKLLGSLKNITNIKTIASNLINTYDIMNSNRLVITREAFKSIEEIWDSNIKKRGSKDED